MFKVNDDLSIYVTRGDIVSFAVTATKDDAAFTFKAGDVVRIKVFAKKACENVVLQKDFGVDTDTNSVEIFLSEMDTRIGGVISKPTDYWYEIELNPFDDPQTIIGYDEDGAKVFKLFPEGKDLEGEVLPEDVPVVDSELDMTSTRPIENQAVARQFAVVESNISKNAKAIEDSAKELDKKKLDKAGGVMSGNINMSGNMVTGLGDPDEDSDAVNLGYANKTYAVGKSYVSNNTDLNTVTASGMYRLGGSLVNAPSGASYGQLCVIHGGGDSIAQLCFDFTMARMWVRTGAPAEVDGAGTWTEWAQCYTTAKKPTASDVGATPASHATDKNNPHGVTNEQIGAAPMTYAKKVGAPHNLLDNSDFRNPVNQRGQTVYTADKYTIDRWTSHSNNESVTLNSNGVTIKAKSGVLGWFNQKLEGSKFLGKTYTAAIKLANGKVVLATGTFPSSYPTSDTVIARTDTPEINVNLFLNAAQTVSFGQRINGSTVTIEWAALYEGEYTAETLPEYQPKGYAAELAECQRYAVSWYPYNRIHNTLCNASTIDFILPLPQTMRTPPSIDKELFVVNTSGVNQDGFSVSVKSQNADAGFVSFRATKANHGLTSALLEVRETAILSADL